MTSRDLPTSAKTRLACSVVRPIAAVGVARAVRASADVGARAETEVVDARADTCVAGCEPRVVVIVCDRIQRALTSTCCYIVGTEASVGIARPVYAAASTFEKRCCVQCDIVVRHGKGRDWAQ